MALKFRPLVVTSYLSIKFRLLGQCTDIYPHTKCVCVCTFVCMCVCTCIRRQSWRLTRLHTVNRGDNRNRGAPRFTVTLLDAYTYTLYDTYNVLYRPGGYTVGSPVGCMESRELGRFVCVILYRPIGKFHDRCVLPFHYLLRCHYLLSTINVWYEIN